MGSNEGEGNPWEYYINETESTALVPTGQGGIEQRTQPSVAPSRRADNPLANNSGVSINDLFSQALAGVTQTQVEKRTPTVDEIIATYDQWKATADFLDTQFSDAKKLAEAIDARNREDENPMIGWHTDDSFYRHEMKWKKHKISLFYTGRKCWKSSGDRYGSECNVSFSEAKKGILIYFTEKVVGTERDFERVTIDKRDKLARMDEGDLHRTLNYVNRRAESVANSRLYLEMVYDGRVAAQTDHPIAYLRQHSVSDLLKMAFVQLTREDIGAFQPPGYAGQPAGHAQLSSGNYQSSGGPKLLGE